MTWFISYFTSTLGLIGVTGLAVFICLGIAWVLKDLKWAIAGAIVLAVGLAYAQIDHNAFQRAEAAQARATIDTLQHRLLAINMIAAQDAQRATADTYLNNQLDALTRDTPYNPGPCLSLDAARRVRAIGAVQPNAPAVPARRSTGLFQRRSRGP